MSESNSDVSVETTVENGRTVVDVSGTREAAVVIRADGEERIYLPPEEFEEPVGGDSPYQAARDSPYQSSERASPYRGVADQGGGQSPYQSTRTAPSQEGTHTTRDGFRVVHPAEASELTVFR
ncbi:MAG: hypothetical protein ABEJ79_07305 [Halolamina sp.]